MGVEFPSRLGLKERKKRQGPSLGLISFLGVYVCVCVYMRMHGCVYVEIHTCAMARVEVRRQYQYGSSFVILFLRWSCWVFIVFSHELPESLLSLLISP